MTHYNKFTALFIAIQCFQSTVSAPSIPAATGINRHLLATPTIIAVCTTTTRSNIDLRLMLKYAHAYITNTYNAVKNVQM